MYHFSVDDLKVIRYDKECIKENEQATVNISIILIFPSIDLVFLINNVANFF